MGHCLLPLIILKSSVLFTSSSLKIWHCPHLDLIYLIFGYPDLWLFDVDVLRQLVAQVEGISVISRWTWWGPRQPAGTAYRGQCFGPVADFSFQELQTYTQRAAVPMLLAVKEFQLIYNSGAIRLVLSLQKGPRSDYVTWCNFTLQFILFPLELLRIEAHEQRITRRHE